MKVASWKDCVEDNLALESNRNNAKARSLRETANARIEFLEDNKIDERNANFIFEGYYTSTLEMLHALAIIKGFKVKNHICL